MASLLLSAFSLCTIISVLFLAISVFMVLWMRWIKLREAGLISFLPQSMAPLLLHRSFFDVLCDLWFYPRIGRILKAIATPFLIEITPENAMQLLDTLDENDKKLFLTKGAVYAMPRWLKHMILPKSYKIHQKINEFMDSEDDHPVFRTKDEEPADFGSFLSVQEKVGLMKEPTPRFAEDAPCRASKNRLILSSQMLKGLRHLPGKLIEEWDNLSRYRREAKDRRRVHHRSTGEEDDAPEANRSMSLAVRPTPVAEKLSAINMVMNLIEAKKQKVLKRFSQKFLVGAFVVLVCVFAVNMRVSRRYRNITKNALIVASYMGIVGVSTATLAAILMKTRSERTVGINRAH